MEDIETKAKCMDTQDAPPTAEVKHGVDHWLGIIRKGGVAPDRKVAYQAVVLAVCAGLSDLRLYDRDVQVYYFGDSKVSGTSLIKVQHEGSAGRAGKKGEHKGLLKPLLFIDWKTFHNAYNEVRQYLHKNPRREVLRVIEQVVKTHNLTWPDLERAYLACAYRLEGGTMDSVGWTDSIRHRW